MSFKNLVIILISCVLIFATVPPASAQSRANEDNRKQTTTAKDWKHGKHTGKLSKARVREVQTALRDKGYDPGPIDGIMGVLTITALRGFQAANGLSNTGMVDEPTAVALGTSSNLSDAQLKKQNDEIEQGIPPEQQSQNTSRQARMKPQTQTHDTAKVDKEAAERIEKAASVLQDLTQAEDKRIPDALLERAQAVAVIPNMVKGAFVVGGRYGKGVVSKRLSDGRWSPPAFIQIGGGSFGLQIGGSSTDLVLVFTDAKALSLLEKGKDLKLGVDAGIVAGPIGRTAEAGVNANLETAIYSYSRAKGLFAGVALDGAVLDLDDSMNKKVYGSNVAAKDILDGRVPLNMTVHPFVMTLDRVIPKKRISQR
jgi:lipid-binding SYLF domain-containing protein